MNAQTEQCRILIVDDSDFSRTYIAQMFDSEKFNIIGEVANAKEAINILRDRKAHLAIVDVVMPDVSGIELAEYITEHFDDTAIIMISSLGQENIIIDSISAGASDYLQKPFTKEDLLASVDKVLEKVNLKAN
jgi:two-component system chemotaxis response regulator CheY